MDSSNTKELPESFYPSAHNNKQPGKCRMAQIKSLKIQRKIHINKNETSIFGK